MSSIRSVKPRSAGLNCLAGGSRKFRRCSKRNPKIRPAIANRSDGAENHPRRTSTIKNMEEASEYEPEYERIR